MNREKLYSLNDVRNSRDPVNAYMRLKEARNMIPEFDGASHKLPEFLSVATYAMKNTSPREESTLLEAILCTKLKRRAMTDFQTRDIRDFAQLKRELEVCYLSKKSTTHLQLEFNTLKQKPGESARAFGLRTDKIAMELYESMIEGRQGKTESKRAILETIQQQALYNFQLGLQDDIKLLVCAQHYTLQDTIAGTSAEEKFKGLTGNFAHPKVNIQHPSARENRLPQCHKCGKTGHYGRDCRTNKYTSLFPLSQPDRHPCINTMSKYCMYCKKARHNHAEC
ncbi:hypothetical protein P5V15_002783 [Pogonomyrmex californicus]